MDAGRGARCQVYNQVGPISLVFGIVCIGIDIVCIGIGRGAGHPVHNHVGTISSERGIICIGIGIGISIVSTQPGWSNIINIVWFVLIQQSSKSIFCNSFSL